MKKLQQTSLQAIKHPDELPMHLVVQNGQIVTLDGEIPILDLPDGTLVNVVDRVGLKRIIGNQLERKAMLERRQPIAASPRKASPKKAPTKKAKAPQAKKKAAQKVRKSQPA